MIVPIVEGQGEVASVPVLLRRLLHEFGIWDVQIGKPILCKRHQIVREPDLKRSVRLAKSKPGVRAILILCDSDDDCVRDLLPGMRLWTQEIAMDIPFAIVLARREYEAWFLAAMESLRGKCGILPDAAYDADPEAKRGAKEALRLRMPKSRAYDEPSDQPAITQAFDLRMAYRKASSFRKLVKELCRVLTELGYEPTIPADWG